MAGLLDFISLRDMFDGGGAGKAGTRFEGGGLSELLNGLGIRPMGYQDTLSQMRSMPRPMAPMAQPKPPAAPAMAPQPNPYAAGAITQSTLPPIGQMPNEELVRLILQALRAAPASTGYGPR